jgi:hypothetical protein
MDSLTFSSGMIVSESSVIMFIFAMLSKNSLIGLAIWFSVVGDILLTYESSLSLVSYILCHIYISCYLHQHIKYTDSPILYINFMYMFCVFTLSYYFSIGILAIFFFYHSLLIVDNLVAVLTNVRIDSNLRIGYILYIISDVLGFINIHYDLGWLAVFESLSYKSSIAILTMVI